LKKMQLLDFDIMLWQILSESTSFCEKYDKDILVCFCVHSSNCYSLAKGNAKFHKVG